jgi:hypothetical protein
MLIETRSCCAEESEADRTGPPRLSPRGRRSDNGQ